MLDSGYIKALETRAHWVYWLHNEGRDVWRQELAVGQDSDTIEDWIKVIDYHLKVSDTFFMTKHFVDLVNHANHSVPSGLRFDFTWLQAKNGWVFLEKPVSFFSRDLDGEGEVPIHALGWYEIPAGQQISAGRTANEGTVGILLYRTPVDDGSVEQFIPFKTVILKNQESFEEAKMKTGTNDVELKEFYWVLTAFYLMGQRLTLTRRHETDRYTRRRGEREGKPVCSFIRSITLRRLEEDRVKEGQQRNIDWQWQWEVRGHWRNQFLPSTGEHKPVFVEAYIKGPEGKPLKPDSHKIFVARR